MSLKDDLEGLELLAFSAPATRMKELARVLAIVRPLLEMTDDQIAHMISGFEKKNAKSIENIEAKQGRLPAGAAESAWEAIKARRVLIRVLAALRGTP